MVYSFAILTVQIIEMPSLHFILFISFFFSPLGKPEEECSFHTLKALFPSRKWATEDTKVTFLSSNAGDMGTSKLWYTHTHTLFHNTFRQHLSLLPRKHTTTHPTFGSYVTIERERLEKSACSLTE